MNERKPKVYLAHPISTSGEFRDSIRVAERIRSLGYEVYAAAENSGINDKTNNPTPTDIYQEDVSKILGCDVFVVNITGGHQDGTISEIGVVAGINEMIGWSDSHAIPIIAYSSNARILNTQHYEGIASASANHLVLGIVEKWGTFEGGEESMLAHLSKDKERFVL